MKISLALVALLFGVLSLSSFAQDDYDVSSEEVVPVQTPTTDYSDTEIAPPPSDSNGTYVPEESSEPMDY
ncbi:MAG: hypothetical protein Fur0010_01260 [Bdellovibrio sp.]